MKPPVYFRLFKNCFAFMLRNVSLRKLKYIRILFKFFCQKKVEKNHPKKLYTYSSWKFFFSAASTAQTAQTYISRHFTYQLQVINSHKTQICCLKILDQINKQKKIFFKKDIRFFFRFFKVLKSPVSKKENVRFLDSGI